MSEQRRVSTPESGRGGKRPREQATPGGGIKQERRGQEQVEASQGGEGVGAVVTVQTMEELEMNIRIPVARLHCHACLLPFKPPTFKVSFLRGNLNLCFFLDGWGFLLGN